MRPNGLSSNLHDARLRRPMQRRHRLGDTDHDPARTLRNVFRIRHLGGVRIGEERHPTSVGQFLSDAPVERRDLADRRHANRTPIRSPVFTVNYGDDVVKIDVDERLEHHRTGCLLRFRIDHSLDSSVPDYKHNCVESEEGVMMS